MTFKKGEINNPKGRPKGSKNKLTDVKDKLVEILNARIGLTAGPHALSEVSTESLIRFASTIMPKDMSIKVAPDITYISNTPRPEQVAAPVVPDEPVEPATPVGTDGDLDGASNGTTDPKAKPMAGKHASSESGGEKEYENKNA
tara:strand:- start:3219 stop:3650 length:432 start_codon:yes stop_codon:yes gene_type:complete